MTSLVFGQVAFVVLLGSLWLLACRCRFGWHPRSGRMMRNEGRTNGVATASWTCAACHRVVGTTSLRISDPVLSMARDREQAA